MALLPAAYADLATLVVAAACYAAVARLLGRRAPEGAVSMGRRSFRAWWGGASVAMASLAVVHGAFLAGVTSATVYNAFFALFVVANAVALTGIWSHILVVYTGSERLARWTPLLGVAYLLAYMAALMTVAPLTGAQTPGGSHFAQGAVESPLVIAILATFYLPHVLAAYAYLGLLAAVREPEVRYRVMLVSSGILVSTLAYLLIPLARGAGASDGLVVVQLAALLAPVGVLLAYAPPPFVRAWLERMGAVAGQ